MEKSYCISRLDLKQREIAKQWGQKLLGVKFSVKVFTNGINNNVFLLEKNSKRYVVKIYPKNHRKITQRFKAELNFLRYSNKIRNRFVPKILEFDAVNSILILEYIRGVSFSDQLKPSETNIKDAIFFLKLVNEKKNSAFLISNQATEGFRKISEHIENVSKRLNSFSHNHIDPKFQSIAKEKIQMLSDYLDATKSYLGDVLAQKSQLDTLKPEYLCISPGDFGFHNAILTAKRTVFIDFEYAGWDDPAKLYLDFFFQPKNPVPETKYLSEKLLEILNNRQNEHYLRYRIELLRPVLFIKWCCIILAFLDKNRINTRYINGYTIEEKFNFFSNYWEKNKIHIKIERN